MNHLILLGALLAFFLATFAVAQRLKNHGLVDIAWGTGFVLSAWVSFALGAPTGPVPIAMTALVTVWGVRLTWHVARRNLGKPEDFRYAHMRETWDPKTYGLRMFLRIYLLQLVLNYLIALPTVVTNLAAPAGWTGWASAGVAVWAVGFFFETAGDAQLARFKADPANRGKLLTTGLWRYTRHPNYFGEAAQWWGLFLLALRGWSTVWLVLSPLLITLFLLYVSGVPLLERKYAGRADWEAYRRRTPKFFPWLPRK